MLILCTSYQRKQPVKISHLAIGMIQFPLSISLLLWKFSLCYIPHLLNSALSNYNMNSETEDCSVCHSSQPIFSLPSPYCGCNHVCIDWYDKQKVIFMGLHFSLLMFLCTCVLHIWTATYCLENISQFIVSSQVLRCHCMFSSFLVRDSHLKKLPQGFWRLQYPFIEWTKQINKGRMVPRNSVLQHCPRYKIRAPLVTTYSSNQQIITYPG